MLSWVALVLVMAGTAAGDLCLSNARRHSDGCSIPLHLHAFFEDQFTPSCIRHDICYSCALRYGLTREDCDRTFLHATNATCTARRRDLSNALLRDPSSLTRDLASLSRDPVARKRFLFSLITENGFCRIISDSYFEAVHLFAASHFNDPSESFCEETWVRSCLP